LTFNRIHIQSAPAYPTTATPAAASRVFLPCSRRSRIEQLKVLSVCTGEMVCIESLHARHKQGLNAVTFRPPLIGTWVPMGPMSVCSSRRYSCYRRPIYVTCSLFIDCGSGLAGVSDRPHPAVFLALAAKHLLLAAAAAGVAARRRALQDGFHVLNALRGQ